MNSETLIGFLKIVFLPLSGAILGYFLKYYLDKKSEFSSKNAEIKRKMYKEYVELIINFFDDTKKQKSQVEIKNEIYSFYKQYILYASPNVINAFSDLMHQFYEPEKPKSSKPVETDSLASLKKMTRVFKEMRKDIGLSNRGLGVDGEKLLRAMINDYDETFNRSGNKK